MDMPMTQQNRPPVPLRHEQGKPTRQMPHLGGPLSSRQNLPPNAGGRGRGRGRGHPQQSRGSRGRGGPPMVNLPGISRSHNAFSAPPLRLSQGFHPHAPSRPPSSFSSHPRPPHGYRHGSGGQTYIPRPRRSGVRPQRYRPHGPPRPIHPSFPPSGPQPGFVPHRRQAGMHRRLVRPPMARRTPMLRPPPPAHAPFPPQATFPFPPPFFPPPYGPAIQPGIFYPPPVHMPYFLHQRPPAAELPERKSSLLQIYEEKGGKAVFTEEEVEKHNKKIQKYQVQPTPTPAAAPAAGAAPVAGQPAAPAAAQTEAAAGTVAPPQPVPTAHTYPPNPLPKQPLEISTPQQGERPADVPSPKDGFDLKDRRYPDPPRVGGRRQHHAREEERLRDRTESLKSHESELSGQAQGRFRGQLSPHQHAAPNQRPLAELDVGPADDSEFLSQPTPTSPGLNLKISQGKKVRSKFGVKEEVETKSQQHINGEQVPAKLSRNMTWADDKRGVAQDRRRLDAARRESTRKEREEQERREREALMKRTSLSFGKRAAPSERDRQPADRKPAEPRREREGRPRQGDGDREAEKKGWSNDFDANQPWSKQKEKPPTPTATAAPPKVNWGDEEDEPESLRRKKVGWGDHQKPQRDNNDRNAAPKANHWGDRDRREPDRNDRRRDRDEPPLRQDRRREPAPANKAPTPLQKKQEPLKATTKKSNWGDEVESTSTFKGWGSFAGKLAATKKPKRPQGAGAPYTDPSKFPSLKASKPVPKAVARAGAQLPLTDRQKEMAAQKEKARIAEQNRSRESARRRTDRGGRSRGYPSARRDPPPRDREPMRRDPPMRDRYPSDSRDRGGAGDGGEKPFPRSPPFKAFVGNLPFDCTDNEIEDFFRDCKVKAVRVMLDQDGRPRGFAYVEFDGPKDLRDALALNNELLLGRALRIDIAENRGRGGYGGGNRRFGGGMNRDRGGGGGFWSRDRDSGRDRGGGGGGWDRDRDRGGGYDRRGGGGGGGYDRDRRQENRSDTRDWGRRGNDRDDPPRGDRDAPRAERAPARRERNDSGGDAWGDNPRDRGQNRPQASQGSGSPFGNARPREARREANVGRDDKRSNGGSARDRDDRRVNDYDRNGGRDDRRRDEDMDRRDDQGPSNDAAPRKDSDKKKKKKKKKKDDNNAKGKSGKTKQNTNMFACLGGEDDDE